MSSAVSGLMRPEGSGRSRVRSMAASARRSMSSFSAAEPAATSAVPNSALKSRRQSIAPVHPM